MLQRQKKKSEQMHFGKVVPIDLFDTELPECQKPSIIKKKNATSVKEQ